MKNKLKILLISILSIFVIGCSPENEKSCQFTSYDKYQRQGMLDYVGGNYLNSLKNFEAAFNIKNDESENDFFHAAAAALRLNQLNKAEELIKNAIIITNANKSYFENFEGFDGYRHTEQLKSILSNYEIYHKEFLKSQSNPKIDSELDMLINLDQTVREDSSTEDEDMIQQDSLNINRLIEITQNHGWQDKSWLLLWHQRGTFKKNNYVWSYFRPLIDSLISECQIRPDYWALYEDEHLMFTEGAQIYGTYWNNYDSYPIRDIENIDKIREEIGLPPLWYMQKVYNSNLPDGYVASNSK